MKKLFRLVFVCILYTSGSNLNAGQLRGIVRNANDEPLAYANVFVEGRFEGAMTNEAGMFDFNVAVAGDVILLCRFIGYKQYRQVLHLQPNSVTELQIIMQPLPVEGETVRVVASAFTAADEEGVTLTSLDVVRTPGAAADLFWAIKTFPGLQQVDEGAGLFVRGGDVSETITILDGAVIQHPYKYESPTGGFFGTINPFLLKGTYFSSGGFSAQFGDALSGALVMESQDMPSQRSLGIGLGLAAESGYLAMPLVDDKLGISMSGNLSNTRMLFEWNKGRQKFSRYPESSDVNIAIHYHPSKRSKFKLLVFQQNDRLGIEVDDPEYNTHFYGNSEHRFVNLHNRTTLTENVLLQANVAVSEYGRKMSVGVLDLDLNDRVAQSRITLEQMLPGAAILRTGSTCRYTCTDISGSAPIEEDDVNPDAPKRNVNTNYKMQRWAIFSEIEWPIFNGMILTSGIRGERESTRQNYFFTPRMSLSCPLTTHSYLTSAWGLYYQEPEARYFDLIAGNPNLRNMKSMHAILGYHFQKDQRMFRVEAYWKKYDDLILEDHDTNYSNAGHGYASGVDVFLKDAVGPLSGRIAYSWLRARRKWLDAPALCPPYFDIPHNFTLVLNLDLPRAFSLSSSVRYATGKPYTSVKNAYHNARVPAYQKWDLAASWLSSFFPNNMTILYLAMSNVLGRINIFDYKYDEDYIQREPVASAFRRSYYFGVQVNM